MMHRIVIAALGLLATAVAAFRGETRLERAEAEAEAARREQVTRG